jgi:hypothetical protein
LRRRALIRFRSIAAAGRQDETQLEMSYEILNAAAAFTPGRTFRKQAG